MRNPSPRSTSKRIRIQLVFWVLLGIFFSPAQAQQAGGGAIPAAPVAPAAPTGASDGASATAVVPAAGTTVGPTASMGSMNMTPISNLTDPNAPLGIQNLSFPNTAAMGQPMVYQPSSTVQALRMCSSLLSAMAGNPSFGQALFGAALDENNAAGFQYEPGIDEALGRSTGSGLTDYFTTEYGAKVALCQKFMDKEGRVGPWGRLQLARMNERDPNFFSSWNPRDIGRVCPNFRAFNEGEKKAFFIWTFASMSHPESSCNERALNPNAPNGSALGLFQLESRVCPGMSSRDLLVAENNIMCAVDVFHKEQVNRGALFSRCSSDCRRGEVPTYWAPLRSDGRDRGNTIAFTKMVKNLSAFPGCRGGERLSMDSEVRAPAETVELVE